MRVVCLRGGFGLENLVVEERPDPPAPGPNELLLAVRVAALNYRDVSLARGTYDPHLAQRVILGCDAVGEVIACGPGVTRFAIGSRVCPTMARGWHDGPPTRNTARQMLGGPLDGTLCEKLIVNEADAVRPPAHLSDEEASTLGCAGVTAYRALFELAMVGSGQRVLVIGTGGVSTFAISLAQAAGAEVLIVSRDEAKLVKALELGGDHGVHSEKVRQWGLAVRQLTGGEGVDLVIEVGGAATLEQSLKAVRPGGTIALIGHTPNAGPTPSLVPIVMREVRVQGVLVGPRSSFEGLVRRLEHTDVRPVVDHVYKLDEIVDAFEYQASGMAFGKIAVRLAK